jgi:hypothetical protein
VHLLPKRMRPLELLRLIDNGCGGRPRLGAGAELVRDKEQERTYQTTGYSVE